MALINSYSAKSLDKNEIWEKSLKTKIVRVLSTIQIALTVVTSGIVIFLMTTEFARSWSPTESTIGLVFTILPAVSAISTFITATRKSFLTYIGFSRMAHASVPQKFEDVLECTICLDVPASPIHHCVNGHIVCGICVEKIETCGICKDPNFQVSILAERLSRQLDFKLKCPNFDAGCKELISATEIKKHKDTCYYRDVSCDEWKVTRCTGKKIAMKDYIKHLEEQHNNKTISNVSFFYSIECKDGIFIVLDLSMCAWVTIMGSEKEAKKYNYEYKVFKTIEEGRKIELAWTLPVVAFHDRPKYIEGLPYYVNIPMNKLLEFCNPNDHETYKYKFTWSCTILKNI
ncbi:putative E3 ubiquitin-protein ligase SINAT1 isoform X2 [Folsomia candida]|uniref:putative E3 ubiquitin-protein ligase SINAT1 isoform X2 n=1 Tax=Folsomia candida TaxID=158441 RepID=UPI0016051F00|nr:putative E3 ubiquitin-protein ligase SINAT1 isoform X2 [Folsomia candida]